MLDSGAAGRRGGGAVIRQLASVIRRIAGMPDYEGYAEHIRRYHADRPILTEREYYAEYLRTRYGDSPTRCC